MYLLLTNEGKLADQDLILECSTTFPLVALLLLHCKCEVWTPGVGQGESPTDCQHLLGLMTAPTCEKSDSLPLHHPLTPVTRQVVVQLWHLCILYGVNHWPCNVVWVTISLPCYKPIVVPSVWKWTSIKIVRYDACNVFRYLWRAFYAAGLRL